MYAPKWVHPHTGVVTPAHSLGTSDRAEAEHKWALERAGALGAALVRIPTRATGGAKLSDAFVDYLIHKEKGVAAATLASYQGHARAIVETFGDWDLSALAGPLGQPALAQWVDVETARLGRTHTVVKRLEAILKPALRHAYAKGRISRLPVWPQIRNDYRAEGARKISLTREQFAALAGELPERDRIDRADGTTIDVFPRLWADLAVCTGMHDSDLTRFARGMRPSRPGGDWDRREGLWWRRNTKGDAHYAPEWFPVLPYMKKSLERARELREFEPTDLWVASAPPPQQWTRQRLRWASQRAGLCCKNCAAAGRVSEAHAATCLQPQPIDFRRTLATWLRDDGWEFDEVAKILANSSGMVREVYAQVPRARFVAATLLSSPESERLVQLTEQTPLEKRRGPRRARAKMTVVSAVVNTTNGAI